MNVERLKSDRGVHTLEKYCADLKFRGKGHEREDLNNIMKRLEHWAHRLYPSYKFDDFISAVEKLGKKKQIQTHMYRYRHGLLEDVPKIDSDGEKATEEGDTAMRGDDPIDELDEIIDQQIQNYTTIAARTAVHDTTFDSIRSSTIASLRMQKRIPMESSTSIVTKTMDTAKTQPTSTLTSDQMAKIAENRRLAQERLMKKQAEMKAKAAETVESDA